MTNELMDRAELDAERLEGALARLAQGEPLDGLLAEFGPESDLGALVALGGRMSVVLPAEAPAAMRRRHEAVLRQRFAERVTSSRPPRRVGLLDWFALPRPAVSLAAVVLAVAALATTGAVVASASSLPGDALYRVKRVVETTRLAVAFDPMDRVALRMAFAGERIDEIRALIDRGVMPDPRVIEDLIALYAASMREAADGSVPASLIEEQRAAGAAALGAIAAGADPTVQQWLADAVALLVDRPSESAAPSPTTVRSGDEGGGDARGAAIRVGPTVARPSEAAPALDPPITPTAVGPAAITAPLPTATTDALPAWPSPAAPTPDGGGGGPGDPPPAPPALIGDPPPAATSVPPAPPSSIEEQRRRDLTNTPAPPPPGGRPGHGGSGSPPPRP